MFKTPTSLSLIQTNAYLLYPFISSSSQLCSQLANQNFPLLTCGACGTVAMETTPSPERRCSISTGLLDLPSDHTAPTAWPSGKNKTVNACPQLYLQQSELVCLWQHDTLRRGEEIEQALHVMSGLYFFFFFFNKWKQQ